MSKSNTFLKKILSQTIFSAGTPLYAGFFPGDQAQDFLSKAGTEANTATYTSEAPLSVSTCAQASAVAPVVNTSSISRTVCPSRG